MSGWSGTEILQGSSQAISGVVTNQVISKEAFITAEGALHYVAKIVASGVTVVGTITAKLQTAIGGDWVDSKTATISGNGNFYIKLAVENSSDQTYLPLLNKARIVITTTNAGDAVTVSSIMVLQAL